MLDQDVERAIFFPCEIHSIKHKEGLALCWIILPSLTSSPGSVSTMRPTPVLSTQFHPNAFMSACQSQPSYSPSPTMVISQSGGTISESALSNSRWALSGKWPFLALKNVPNHRNWPDFCRSHSASAPYNHALRSSSNSPYGPYAF